jgi:hypothetical protein
MVTFSTARARDSDKRSEGNPRHIRCREAREKRASYLLPTNGRSWNLLLQIFLCSSFYKIGMVPRLTSYAFKDWGHYEDMFAHSLFLAGVGRLK